MLLEESSEIEIVWIQIRIHKAAEYGSNLYSDPRHSYWYCK